MTNEEKDSKEVIEQKERRNEASPEIEKEKNLKEILTEGREGVKENELKVVKEIQHMGEMVKAQDLNPNEYKKVVAVEEGLKRGVEGAKDEYELESEPLKNNSGRIEQYNKNLDEVIKKIDEKEEYIKGLEKSFQEIGKNNDPKYKDKISILKGGIQVRNIELLDLKKRKKKLEKFIQEERGDIKQEISGFKIKEKQNLPEKEAFVCPKCNKKLIARDKYCVFCGNRIIEENKGKQDLPCEGKKDVKKGKSSVLDLEGEKSKFEEGILINEINEVGLLDELSAEEKKEKMKILSSKFLDFSNKDLFGGDEKKFILNLIRETEKGIKINESLQEAEDKFEIAFEEVRAYNPTLPNYFKRRFESLKTILRESEKNNSDRESINFLKKAVERDIKSIVQTMAAKENIDIYYVNEGKDKGGHKEQKIETIIEYINNKDNNEDSIRTQLKAVDQKLINVAKSNYHLTIFADEYTNARIAVETAESSINLKERKAYFADAKHILDNLEIALEDEEIKGALTKRW